MKFIKLTGAHTGSPVVLPVKGIAGVLSRDPSSPRVPGVPDEARSVIEMRKKYGARDVYIQETVESVYSRLGLL